MNPPPDIKPVPAPRPTPLALRLFNSREVIFRVVIVVVILISLVVASWSFFKVLPPLQKQSRELASNYAQMNAEVDKLSREWPETRATEVTNKYGQVRERLFSSEPAFSQWLANLNGQASTLTLDAKADFGKTTPVPAAGEKLATIPATIFLEVHPSTEQTPASPYQRLARLAQQLGDGQRRTDMAELTVSGGTGSISRAVMVLNLWAGEEDK